MQEQFKSLTQRLGRGLYRDRRLGQATDEMRVMRNLVPMGAGAHTPERVEYPFGVDYPTMDWPFPMVYVGENVLLEFGAQSVSTVTPGTWTKTAVTVYDVGAPDDALTIPRGGVWHVVSFQDLWFASNGAALLWDIPSNTDGKVLGTTALIVQALGRFENRLILGGLAGDWFTGDEWTLLMNLWRETGAVHELAHRDQTWDTRWVCWGERGGGDSGIPFYVLLCALGVFGSDAFETAFSDIMDRFERRDLGMLPVRTPGALQHVRQLGGNLAVYGEQGVSLLAPVEAGFQEAAAGTVGVPERGCVGGHEREHVYVNNDGRVIRWPAGAGMTDLGYDAHVRGKDDPTLIFGTEGYGNGQFIGPIYVAVTDKRIYVSDVQLERIQLFDHGGNYLSQFAAPAPGSMAIYENELYVLDTGAQSVRVYTLAGAFVRSWGSAGVAAGNFWGIGAISVWDGEVYVVDHVHGVQVFSTAGVYRRGWNAPGAYDDVSVDTFVDPKGLMAYHDLVWVADTGNARVCAYTRAGHFVREFDGFDLPVSVAVMGELVYVLEHSDARIQVYDDEAVYDRQFGAEGGGAVGQFLAPWCLIEHNGFLYIGDTSNHRVQVLSAAMVRNVVVSYDPLLDQYWIASQHGAHVLTQFGLGWSDQAPTSLHRWGGNRLIGAAVAQEPATKRWRFTTTSLSMGVRDSKKLTTAAATTHGMTDGRARVNWRTNRESWYRHGAWRPVNSHGVAFPGTSFEDGELVTEGYYEAVDGGSIDAVEIRFQMQGRVFRRGLANVQADRE